MLRIVIVAVIRFPAVKCLSAGESDHEPNAGADRWNLKEAIG